MGDLGFAFDNLDSSDTVLRIEIVSGKDFLWLKSFVKRFPYNAYIHAAVHDLESSRRSVRVRTLNVISRILSSESLYFYKLFKNDTKESHQKEVTLKINASEEEALMDLLNFMYINNLSAATPRQLESVRMIAEKLEATSCVKYVHHLSRALHHQLYDGEPSCALMAEAVEPLKDAAKKHLVERHRDFTESRKEAMGLPLCALEIVLGSPGIRLDSEDSLFYFIMEWMRSHCRDYEEDRTIRVKRLYRFIYFPYISLSTIGWVLRTDHFHIYPMFEAMRISDGCTHKIQRVYKYHPLKVVDCSASPLPRCAVYFFLTKQDLDNLFRSKQQLSEVFYPGKRFTFGLLLMARCNKAKQSSSEHFGLFVGRSSTAVACIKFDYEFAVLTKKPSSRSNEYQIMAKADNRTITEKFIAGQANLFGIPWAHLMADDCEYFVDGILHLRAEITLTN